MEHALDSVRFSKVGFNPLVTSSDEVLNSVKLAEAIAYRRTYDSANTGCYSTSIRNAECIRNLNHDEYHYGILKNSGKSHTWGRHRG